MTMTGRGNATTKTGVIEPHLLYTLEELAAAIRVTPRTLREQLILTGEVHAVLFAKTYLVPGWAFIKWAESVVEDHQRSA
jgi:hypothetical protein